VNYAKELYGTEFLVYNVHALLHVCDDVRLYGQLDNISCFPYENKKLSKSLDGPPFASSTKCTSNRDWIAGF
jgi:hypothetical protein